VSLLSAFDSVLLTDGLLFSACQVFDRSPPRFCFTTCANNSKSCARGSRKRFDSRERTIGLESYRRIHQRVQGRWLGGLFERSTFSPTPLSCSRLLTISASPCQWSSVSQGAGATITLRWPYRVNVGCPSRSTESQRSNHFGITALRRRINLPCRDSPEQWYCIRCPHR